jgi:putative acetyltransferase
MLINIREERAEDIATIRRVNVEAFGQPREANLIELLRTNGGILLSLVATYKGQVAGHILSSPVTAGAGEKKIVGAGLGPMAVLPEHQRSSGTRLLLLNSFSRAVSKT